MSSCLVKEVQKPLRVFPLKRPIQGLYLALNGIRVLWHLALEPCSCLVKEVQKGFSTKEVDSRLYLALNGIRVLWHLRFKPSIGTCFFHHWIVDSPTINSRILSYKDSGLNGSASCPVICFMPDKLCICLNLAQRIPIVSCYIRSVITPSLEMCEPLCS